VDVVGLIPARGGSKSIPGKNLADVAGKSLLAWTVEAAREARSVTRVVVSTDDDAIAEASAALGVEVLRRPSELAADDSPMLDVLLHAAGAVGGEALAVLQPTSPLRRAEHVDGAVALLEESTADAVVSVVPVPHAFTPGSLLELHDGRISPLDPDAPLLRQRKPALYARNGPAILVVRTQGLAERGLYGGDVRAYEMSPGDSLDVDGPYELKLARLLLG
jgi:CMP-N,N'-diacetyllegionaminic acid synthase